jgi:large subunit ribosomal protein L32
MQKVYKLKSREGGIKMKLNITLFGALPFRRISKTAKRQRRTHLKKTAPTTSTCTNCGAVVAPHRACTKCGYYKGKEAIKVAKEDKE